MEQGLAQIGIHELADVVGARIQDGPRCVVFQGICSDSRRIQPGQLFWALKGDRFDGHDFVHNALARGASGAVVEESQAGRFAGCGAPILCVQDTLYALGELARWWRAKHRVLVGAVTGSVGKTTTKEMAACVLSLHHDTLKTEGNLNNLIGLPLTLLQLEERHSRAVVEMGMNRPGEIARLTQIADPDAGVITEIGKAHLEGLGSLLGVARAKLEMAQQMKEGAPLIVNGDNHMLKNMASQYGREVLSFGLGEDNDVRAHDLDPWSPRGARFTIVYKRDRAAVNLKVTGHHNIMNGLAATGLCIGLGHGLDEVARGLEIFEGLRGRFEMVNLAAGITLIDDTYNANPVSLKAALKEVGGIAQGGRDLIIGLGDMLELGVEAEHAHIEAGRWVAALKPSLFVAIGEFAPQLLRGATEGGLPGGAMMVAGSLKQMADIISGAIRPHALIFLKASRKIGLDKVREMIVKKTSTWE